MSQSIRPVIALFALLAVLPVESAFGQFGSSPIITQREARRHGLHRAWLTAIDVDRSQDSVTSMVLYVPPKPKDQGGQPPPLDGGEVLGGAPPAGAGPMPPPQDAAPKKTEPAEEAEFPGMAGTLYVQSKRGLLHALDAGTGRKLWVAQVGSRDRPSEPPAVNSRFVAVVNGIDLFVLDRLTGGNVFQKKLDVVPITGLAMNEEWVYVPSISGMIMAYKLPELNLSGGVKPTYNVADDDRALRELDKSRQDYAEGRIDSWRFLSYGVVTRRPIVTKRRLAWATSRGFIFMGSQNSSKVDTRFDTHEPVTAPLSYWPPNLYCASRDGYVYAIEEVAGNNVWRYPVAEPMNEPPVAIEDSVYAVPETGGIHCLAVADGQRKWFAPRVMKVLSVSNNRVYTADSLGQMLVLDRKTGGRLDSFSIDRLDLRFTNQKTDRIFLGSRTGLLHCLHELTNRTPVIHRWPEKKTGIKIDQPKKQP